MSSTGTETCALAAIERRACAQTWLPSSHTQDNKQQYPRAPHTCLRHGVAHVHEGYMHGLMLRQLSGFVDAVGQSSGCILIDEAQAVEAGNGGGVEHGQALGLCVRRGH